MSNNLILCDMDGVLVDVQSRTHLPLLNEKFGTGYTLEDLERFDYFEYMPEEHAQFMIDCWHREDLYDGVSPEPGAMEGVEQLRELGRVVVVSSPMDGHGTSKLRWLTDHGFSRDNRVLAKDKALIDIEGALLIDDGPEFLREHRGPKIVFDRPWNRHLEISHWPYTARAHSWSDVVTLAHTFLG